MRHILGYRRGSWELSVSGLEGLSVDDLRLDVQPREVRLQADGFPDLCARVPDYAALDPERCRPRLKRGVLTISWPAVLDAGSRECCLRPVSSSPLAFACDNFLSPEECRVVIGAAIEHGQKRTGVGDYEVKYDMDSFPLQSAKLTPEQRGILDRAFARVDAICGVPRHKDEQVPRVHCYPASVGGHSGRMPLGLHIDTNGRPLRFATAIVYLADTGGGDGATVFPCADDRQLGEVGRELLAGGSQHSSNLADPDHKPLARALVEASEQRAGLSVNPEVGKLLVFFTRLDDGSVDGTSWHGGARVAASRGGARGQDKWILQFFKEIPEGHRSREAAATFCATRRSLPEFSLHGVTHRIAAAGEACAGFAGEAGAACAEAR